MNLGQIKTAIQARGYATDTVTQQIGAINTRYHELVGLHKWPWLETSSGAIPTVTGQLSYALTAITDLLFVDAVRLSFPSSGTPTEEYDLEYISSEDFDSYRFELGADLVGTNGIPRYWTQDGGAGGSLNLLPTPDRVYKLNINYLRVPVDLTVDADTPVFPSTFHDILVWGAIVDMAFRERDWSGMQMAQGEYSRMLGQMERAHAVRQRQNSTHVKRTRWWNQGRFDQ